MSLKHIMPSNFMSHWGHRQRACAWLFAEIDSIGWEGFLGAEYIPPTKTEDSLKWLKPFL